MTQTKEQKAQQYAEKKRLYAAVSGDGTSVLYTPKQFINAFIDGYTACEQSQWRSVEDELPEEYENVLTVGPYDFSDPSHYAVAYYDGEDWYTADGEHIRPTHWMPIPSLPETNTEKK